MEHIELFAETLKEKIIEAEREYELLFAGDGGLQCNMFEGETGESQNTAGSTARI